MENPKFVSFFFHEISLRRKSRPGRCVKVKGKEGEGKGREANGDNRLQLIKKNNEASDRQQHVVTLFNS